MPPNTAAEPLASKRERRRHLGIRGELKLALLPTVTILLVLVLIEVLSTQRLLFASLASSAFLIYLDPLHATNTVRTLTLAQISAALLGWVVHLVLGPGYGAAGVAMVLLIIAMVTADAVHPPAVGTAMSFALRGDEASDLALFAMATGILCVLVGLQRVALWLLVRLTPRH
jgi:CBS-domain-containing membrane protein